MRNIFHTGVLDKALFSVIVVGILLAAYGGLRYLDLANKLANNMSAQIQAEGGEVELESKEQAQGLMASDIERRRLADEQSEMMLIGGIGLALLGLGWLGTDLLGSRRRKRQSAAGLSKTSAANLDAPEHPA